MNKGLDALKRIKPYADSSIDGELEIIENDLKAYEELESMYEELAGSYNKLCQEKIEWLKQKHALEIIKDRLIVEDKGGYIQVVCEFSIPSKNKKYDLLKEVLL